MTVIVGVDGSVGARAALEFAVDEAALRRSGLRVIAVVQLPAYGITAMAGFVPPPPEVLVEDVRRAVQQHVDDLVAAREVSRRRADHRAGRGGAARAGAMRRGRRGRPAGGRPPRP